MAVPSWKRKHPYLAAAYDYCIGVERGKIPACKLVKQACVRQLDDLDRENWHFVMEPAAAESICETIESLRHVKGAWASRREKIRLEPWQCFSLTTPFGWKLREDIHDDDGTLVAAAGTRRFRTVYEEVPRKNAKSTKAAGVGLHMLTRDNEHGAEVYSAATTRDQARIVFAVAQQMARKSDLGTEVRAHSINRLETASFFRALHAQGNTLDGLNVHCAINDEVHAWEKRSVYEVIETALGAREQPMIYNITTAGTNLEGICMDLRTYLVGILDGKIEDDSFFGVIYTIDNEDAESWDQSSVWRKANPNWGVSVFPMDMRALANKARELPSELNGFMTKRLNVWRNAATAWMDMLRWEASQDTAMRFADFEGSTCWMGIDLASKIDVNSLAVLFKKTIDGEDHIFCFMRHWLPEAAVNNAANLMYDGWVRAGHIRATPGNIVDIDEIERETLELSTRVRLVELGVDPGHNSTQYSVHMMQEGLEVVDVRPTVLNFSEPMKWLEAFVKDGRWHSNCPVLTWMVSNVIAKPDFKDNIYPRKQNAARKIDGVIAVLIALNRMFSGDGESVYESRGVIG